MSLKSELQEIRGIGDAKADAIIDVLDDHKDNTTEIRETLEEALEYYNQGDENICAEYVEQAIDQL